MTITVTSLVAGPFTATGLSQTTAFAFKVFSDEEIEVYYGADETVVDPADYTVDRNISVAGDALEGGDVTLDAGAIASGESFYIRAVPEFIQEQTYTSAGTRLENLNEALDRGALRDIHMRDRIEVVEGINGNAADAAAAAAEAEAARVAAVAAQAAAEAAGPHLAANVNIANSGTGAVTRTVEAKLREPAVSAADFATVAQAVATGKDVYFPAASGPYSFDSITVTTAGQRFFGDGEKSIIRATDATLNLFDVRAAGVCFSGLRFEGAATAATTSTFAIYTASGFPAPRLLVDRCIFSGDGSTKGFTNAIKLDTGADYAVVRDSYFERLWGTASGFGYGVLCGAATGVVVSDNTFVGAANRGRHAVYLSSGASYCKVSKNHVSAFTKAGITVYATDAQPACDGNVISGNTLISCSDAVDDGAISLSRNVINTIVSDNVVQSSGGCGILADGTGSTKLKNNQFIGNQIIDSAYMGIDLKSLGGGKVVGNELRENGRAVAGTYPNIRLISDGTTATTDILFSGNRSTGTTYARSAFQINTTAPTPTGIVLKGNDFRLCNLAQYELNGVQAAIDGWLVASATWDPGSTADGAIVTKDAIAVTGAEQGDFVMAEHSAFTDAGWFMRATCYSNGFVRVSALNKTGGTLDLASGTVQVRVRKETN